MSGSSRSSMDGWMGAVILAVIGGMIGARASGPPTSARPRSPAEVPAAVKLAGPAAAPAQQEPEPSVSVPARSWEDPLGAARAYLKAKNVEPPSQFEDDPLVRYRIVVPMDSDETADDIDSRMGMRVAISAALHRLGMAPVRSRLQLARVEARSQRQSDVVAAETWEPATTLPPTANFGGRCQVLYLPSKLLDGAGAGVVSGLDQLLVDLDLATTRCLLLRSGSTLFRDDLVEVIKRPRRTDCDVNLTIVNTSSTADLKFLFARVLAPSSGEPEMLRKTVGELAGRTDSPARYSCGDVEVRRILGSDTALLAKLAAELTLRGVNTANPQNVIAVIHDRNSDYGRALPKSFAEALGTDKSLVPIAFASPLDADPRFAPKLLLPDRGQSGQHEQQAIISAGERQVDFIHRALQDLSTDLETTDRGRLRAVFIGATDRWDVRPTVQMIKEKFPEALILMTDLYSQYADPGEYDVMRNVVIASHLDLRAHDALSRDLPPFRSCYHTAAFLAVLQGYGSLVGPAVATDRLVSVGGIATAEQKDEISAAVRGDYPPQGRVFEISRHGATNLETRNSSAPRAASTHRAG